MDEDGLPLVGAGVDLTKVEAIHQKRMLAFLNHFITHTVRFLNKFSCVCEEKLGTLNLRLQKLETTLSILEAKLASIPELDSVTAASTAPSTGSTAPQPITSVQSQPQQPTVDQTEQPDDVETVVVETAPSTNPVSKDPNYAKYFKMLLVGIPAQAVKQKMKGDGKNPDLLDTPDAPAPPPDEDSESDFSDNDSQSSFSD